jgi:hypothetical protein
MVWSVRAGGMDGPSGKKSHSAGSLPSQPARRVAVLGHPSSIRTTEYTESGNCHFLAYISSCWKNELNLVRVGGARPPPFTLPYYHVKVVVYAPVEMQVHYPYFYSIPMYSVVRTTEERSAGCL